MVTAPTRPFVETGICRTRVAGLRMSDRVSSSALTRAASWPRSTLTRCTVTTAQAPPATASTRPAAAATRHTRSRRGASARASTRCLSSGNGSLSADPAARTRLPRAPPALRLAPPAAAAPHCVERPVAGDRKDPRHERSTPRVVLIDVPPHLLEHVAHDVLGFGLVLQDTEGDAE